MRIIFRNIERAKKASKSLAASANGVTLSAAQETVATLAGYRDWHDLAGALDREQTGTPITLRHNDQTESRVISLVLTLSELHGLAFGDALYALVQMRLPGCHIEDVQAHEDIWLQLFKLTQPIHDDRYSPGTVIKVKSETPGWTGEHAILKKYGYVTHLITHKSPDSTVADFEVVFPRDPLPLFVPARLKLAYGLWTEEDGSRVLFSRDYKPLWRISAERKPQRLDPWLWINRVDSQHFWDDGNTPWRSVRRREEEESRLRDFGVSALPKLVNTLPDLVFKEDIDDVGDAVELMARREDPDSHETSER